MNITVDQQQSDIIEDVIQRLKEFQPGQRFWSVRKLMQHYDVSQRVIESVLNQLAARNMISVHPGRGVFINDLSARKIKRILYLCPDWPSAGFIELGQLLEEFAAKEKKFTVTWSSFSYDSGLLDKVDISGIDAMVIFPTSSALTLKHMSDLMKLPFPVVVVGKDLQDIDISCVCGRGDMSGSLAAAHLINNGHSKLAVLVTEPHCHEVYLRHSSFAHFAELTGKSVKTIDCGTAPWEKSDEKAYRVLSEYLDHNGLDFSGLYVVSDGSAIGAMKAITEHGYNIPGDVSVIGNDGIEQGKFLHPALTSIKTDYRKMVKQIFSGLEDIFNSDGDGIFRISIEPELVVRESVKDLNNTN